MTGPHSFVQGGLAALHQGSTMRSQTVPTESEQQAQASDRLNDPAVQPGLAAAMDRARLFAEQIAYEQHGETPKRSPVEQARLDELAALPARLAAETQATQTAAEPTSPPPGSSAVERLAQRQLARNMTDAEFAAYIADAEARQPLASDAEWNARFDALPPAAPPPETFDQRVARVIRESDEANGPPKPTRREYPIGPVDLDAKRQRAAELAQSYSANAGAAIR